MPYSRKQAVAIFLSIKRKKGEGEAEAFGKKHRQDFKKSNKRKSRRLKKRRRG